MLWPLYSLSFQSPITAYEGKVALSVLGTSPRRSLGQINVGCFDARAGVDVPTGFRLRKSRTDPDIRENRARYPWVTGMGLTSRCGFHFTPTQGRTAAVPGSLAG